MVGRERPLDPGRRNRRRKPSSIKLVRLLRSRAESAFALTNSSSSISRVVFMTVVYRNLYCSTSAPAADCAGEIPQPSGGLPENRRPGGCGTSADSGTARRCQVVPYATDVTLAGLCGSMTWHEAKTAQTLSVELRTRRPGVRRAGECASRDGRRARQRA